MTSVQKLQNLESFMGQPFSFFVGKLTDEQFEKICNKNRDFKIEQSAEGELLIMPPPLPDTGWRNSRLTRRIGNWTEENTGIDFDSSTIFTLKNGAKRSPDAAWMTTEKWNNLTAEQKKTSSKITPDFVIELRSATDSVKSLQAKMHEYIENGVRLGWLIDPKKRKVYIYRANDEVEILKNPEKLSGEDVMVGFEFAAQEIF